MIKKIIAICFLIIPLCFAIKFDKTYIVTKIIDGDTVYIMGDNGRELKIRLFGIEAPEYKKNNSNKTQPFGYEAYQAISNKIYGKKITVDVLEGAAYWRIGCIVSYRDRNKSINEYMISEGLAYIDTNTMKRYKHFEKEQLWIELQKEAILNKRGVWSDTNRIYPSDFRNMKK